MGDGVGKECNIRPINHCHSPGGSINSLSAVRITNIVVAFLSRANNGFHPVSEALFSLLELISIEFSTYSSHTELLSMVIVV